jgi:hypothetical protein
VGKQSHGTVHHADTSVECPGCGRKFIHPHHCGVAEDWGEFIGVQFKSKQTGLWGVIRVPRDLVFWGETHRAAWDAELAQRPRTVDDALVRIQARITEQRRRDD